MTDFKHDRLPPDARGTIDKLEVSGVKFNVLFTRKGSYRSGDEHPNRQFDLVLSGEAEVTMMHRNVAGGAEITRHVHAFDTLEIPRAVPHLFYFPVDTVMLEWWDGPFEATYYEPYRKIVEAQNA